MNVSNSISISSFHCIKNNPIFSKYFSVFSLFVTLHIPKILATKIEIGVTPIQILSSESKARNDINQILSKPPYSNSKGESFNIYNYKLKFLYI